MALSHRQLVNAAARYDASDDSLLKEAKERGQARTAFLSHSHKDKVLALGLQKILFEQGCRVYIDWQDTEMPTIPNRETAATIKKRIASDSLFLFLATSNSMSSRWCPWEIGYADGVKPYEAILIIPTVDDGGVYHGSEYLQLYRSLRDVAGGNLYLFEAGSNTAHQKAASINII